MNESTRGMKASELIDALSDEFEIDDERAREVAIERIQKNQMPIYLRALIGVGSFVTAGFLMAIIVHKLFLSCFKFWFFFINYVNSSSSSY